MRVLIVNQYYPPDTSSSAVMLARIVRAFADRGHTVSVVAGRPSYDPSWSQSFRPLRIARDSGGRVLRLPTTAFDRRSAVGRIVNYVTYLLLAVPAVLLGRGDVIVAMTDPPLAVLSAVLGARGRPVVYNVRDLHPDFGLAAGLFRPGFAATWWERLHRWCLRRCALIVVLGDDMAGRIRDKGLPVDRIRVVHNGAEPVPDISLPDPVVEHLRAGFGFVCVHAGNIGLAGAWDTLVESARLVADEDIGFVFVGHGAERDRLERTGVANLRFHEFLPAEDVPKVMAAGDVQIVTLRPGLEGLVVPSKLYGILAAGRPVLVAAPRESDAARIVEAGRCGVVVDPRRPQEVADAVRCLRAHPEELARMSERARITARRFERGRCLAELAEVVEEVASFS